MSWCCGFHSFVFISKQDLKEKKEVSQSKVKSNKQKLEKWASQHRPISIPKWLRKKKKKPTTYSTGYANYLRFSTFGFFCQLLQLISQLWPAFPVGNSNSKLRLFIYLFFYFYFSSKPSLFFFFFWGGTPSLLVEEYCNSLFF